MYAYLLPTRNVIITYHKPALNENTLLRTADWAGRALNSRHQGTRHEEDAGAREAFAHSRYKNKCSRVMFESARSGSARAPALIADCSLPLVPGVPQRRPTPSLPSQSCLLPLARRDDTAARTGWPRPGGSCKQLGLASPRRRCLPVAQETHGHPSCLAPGGSASNRAAASMSRRGGPGSSSPDLTCAAALGAQTPAPEEICDHLLEVPVTRERLNHYWNVAENVRSELAATLVKFESAQSELRDLRSKILSKEVCCQELKAEMERYKENNARKSSLLASLRDRVQGLEEEVAALATSKIRTETTARTAVKENQELMRKIAELDEKLQKCAKESEDNKKQVSENCRKHVDFLTQLWDCLDPDRKDQEASDADLILKLRELCRESTFMKGQIASLEETINVHEMEAKANRETIVRLASDVRREQGKAISWAEEKDKLNQDFLSTVEAKEALEREVQIFQERLLASQRAWDASKQELSLLKKSSEELEKSLKASRDTAVASQSQNSSFREKIAALLRGRLGQAGPTEDAILEKIGEMGSQEESSKRMVSQLESQVSELAEQLGNESESHQKTLQRAQQAENKLEALQGQLTDLEGELVSGEVLRDNLNFEKQKLSEKMKLNQMAAELGFDMRLDVVLARTEQLVRLESNAVIENKTIAHNLQRKLKTQKERLESKELHMNLLRQKIAQLEGERQLRTALAVERDEAHLTVRKLEKKVERVQKELSACRQSNTELKAKLADTNELKIKTLEQTKAIEDLNRSRDKLERMKERAEKKLMSAQSELGTAEHEAKEEKERARNVIEVVTSEMKTLKKSLEEAEKREKQLVDFREVVSQMLGLNVTTLALPDYEIIKHLERLIHSHRHCFVACTCLTDMTTGQDRHPQGHRKLLH
ncbi:PREDICTED: coiled-coil domain-containing protein 170 isoform X2 [Chinchilla lanigera]|uniref:coiled-coil domain-containing protein 170 isoform X2 n=1 Tax=Chinchilla lanigera TaxID=34839 RepID=UPI00069665F5|nr:PREDICTED: coiled-coil domain-containing protein 170 isoform X2 [Chinchilla lanigera]